MFYHDTIRVNRAETVSLEFQENLENVRNNVVFTFHIVYCHSLYFLAGDRGNDGFPGLIGMKGMFKKSKINVLEM